MVTIRGFRSMTSGLNGSGISSAERFCSSEFYVKEKNQNHAKTVFFSSSRRLVHITQCDEIHSFPMSFPDYVQQIVADRRRIFRFFLA